MPNAVDISVKNGANVDKTFALVSPAAGDGGIAMWALKEGAISAVFPVITAMATKTGNNSRKLTIKFKLPSSYTDTVTGKTMVDTGAEMNVSFSMPNDFPETLKADNVAFAINLLNSTLFKAAIRDCYSFT